MMTAVKGYYDGTQIVVNAEDRKNFNMGDELIITILDRIKTDTRTEQRRKIIESGAYVMPSARTTQEIDNYIKELRANDRL
ncbi:MAG: hypothetical protein NC124_02800 [Clostridium sp.]|nr:hypothetical protein [Clostridium sp.]